jgi:phosphoglycolate phosphatase
MKKLILFDYDGTLVDSAKIIVKGIKTAFLRCGFPEPPAEQVKAGIGQKLVDSISTYLPEHETYDPNIIVSEYKRWYEEIIAEGLEFEPLFPGVYKLVKSLKEDGWLLGIATNKSSRSLYRGIEHHKIKDFFDIILTSDKFSPKPKPDMAISALNSLQVKNSHVIMIGDTIYDMEMGRLAGLQTIGVTWGYNSKDSLEVAGANYLADTVEQLQSLLRNEKENMEGKQK